MKKTVKKAFFAFSTILAMIVTMAAPIVSPFVCTVSAAEYVSRGIDVSSNNGDIDWTGVSSSGIDFAIIRAGSTYINGETFHKDRKFETNYSDATKSGIKVGAYYYCGAYTKDGFINNAYDFVNTLNGKSFDLPVYIDVEQATKQTALGKYTLTSYILSALDIISNSGYSAGVYTNKYWFSTYVDVQRIKDAGYDIWMAQYPSGSYAVDPSDYDKSSSCSIWQYSNVGRVSGLSGNVDVDVSYVNYSGANTPLVAPNVNVSVNGQIVTISWNKVTNATHYDLRLYYADGRHLYDNWGGSPDETELRFKMDPNTEYKVQVCSANDNGNFVYCNPVYFTTGSANYSEKAFEDYSSVSISEGVYYFSPKCAPNSCIDSEGGETLYENYSHNIHLWTYLGNSNQQFSVEFYEERDGKKLYTIKNTLTGQYLIMDRGNNVTESPYILAKSKWYFLDCGNGYYKIINFFNDLALDIYNAESNNGANAWGYDPSDMNNSAQLFKLNNV